MRRQQGFTLPELVVAIVVLIVLLLATALLLRPKDYAPQNYDAERRLGAARLVQALARYQADNGAVINEIPEEPTHIASLEDGYDLCSLLVPKYLSDIPLDPLYGVKVNIDTEEDTAESCAADDVEYASGYEISRDKQGKINITARFAQQSDVSVGL